MSIDKPKGPPEDTSDTGHKPGDNAVGLTGEAGVGSAVEAVLEDPFELTLRQDLAVKHNAVYVAGFHDDRAWVQTQTGEFYFIDRNGERTSTEYDFVESFREGLAVVGVGGPGEMRFHYINTKGERAFSGDLDRGFARASSFSEGRAVVTEQEDNPHVTEVPIPTEEVMFGETSRQEGKEGDTKYIDGTGEVVIAGPFFSATDFQDGVAFITTKPADNEHFYDNEIGLDGEEVTRPWDEMETDLPFELSVVHTSEEAIILMGKMLDRDLEPHEQEALEQIREANRSAQADESGDQESQPLPEFPETLYRYDRATNRITRLANSRFAEGRNEYNDGFMITVGHDYRPFEEEDGDEDEEAVYQYLNLDGSSAFEGKMFSYVTPFQEGVAVVQLEINGNAYILDTEGNLKETEFRYIEAVNTFSGTPGVFKDGVAIGFTCDDTGNITNRVYIDTKGREVFEQQQPPPMLALLKSTLASNGLDFADMQDPEKDVVDIDVSDPENPCDSIQIGRSVDIDTAEPGETLEVTLFFRPDRSLTDPEVYMVTFTYDPQTGALMEKGASHHMPGQTLVEVSEELFTQPPPPEYVGMRLDEIDEEYVMRLLA